LARAAPGVVIGAHLGGIAKIDLGPDTHFPYARKIILVQDNSPRAGASGALRSPPKPESLPPELALMRAALRVLSMEEIILDVGVGFDVMLDTVNSFEPAILARKIGKPDPILYFYEDFLQLFDPVARERYGI
jgi:hypothetical protein